MYLDLKIGIFRKIIGMGTGEMDQHLRAPAVLLRTQVQYPTPSWWLTLLATIVPGHPKPLWVSLDNALTWFTEIRAIKIFTYIR